MILMSRDPIAMYRFLRKLLAEVEDTRTEVMKALDAVYCGMTEGQQAAVDTDEEIESVEFPEFKLDGIEDS